MPRLFFGSILAIGSMMVAANCPAQAITYSFDDGTMQGWSNTMVSTAAAGYYDLSFGAATKTGHDGWGAGSNATWSVTGGGSVPPTGPYFLGEIPFEGQIGTTIWSNWPAASSGAQQTIMAQSPAFTLNAGPLTFVGCGSSKGVPLTTLSAIPAIGGTWGSESGNPESSKGSCAVGLLRDDGVFVLFKNFQTTDAWITYTFTASELAPFINDGHAYTLNVVDFWSGQNAWCAIDNVSILGTPFVPKPKLRMALNGNKTKLSLTWNPAMDGQCSVLISDDLSKPLSNWVEVANVATHEGLMATEIPLPAAQTFYRTKLTPPLPAVPSALSATALSSTSIRLAWTDNATNETGFQIERKIGAGGTYAAVATVGANVTSYTNSGLAMTTLYYYRIRAINGPSASSYSTEAYATTLSVTSGLNGEYFSNQNLSGNPTLVRTDAGVNFNWGGSAPDASLPADGFSVRWTGTVQAQYSENYTFYTQSDDGVRLWVNDFQVVNNWTGHSSTEDSGIIALTAGQEVDIRMEYFDSGGDAVAKLSWSSASTPKAVVPQSRLHPPAPLSPPAAPTDLVATTVSSSQINLTWRDNAINEKAYKIERKIGSAGTFVQIETVGANTTSYPNKGLAGNTQYYYRVKSTNALGASVYSGEATATTTTPAALVPAILSEGYADIFDLRITGTPGNWLLSDVSTRQLQSGYTWWYFIGNKIVKTTSNLSNEPWKSNNPGRVIKMALKNGLESFNQWNWLEAPGYYHPDGGMFFERGDCGGVTTFMFK